MIVSCSHIKGVTELAGKMKRLKAWGKALGLWWKCDELADGHMDFLCYLSTCPWLLSSSYFTSILDHVSDHSSNWCWCKDFILVVWRPWVLLLGEWFEGASFSSSPGGSSPVSPSGTQQDCLCHLHLPSEAGLLTGSQVSKTCLWLHM